ncbi:MAG: DNA repair protein RadC [Chitinophagaceae bacterium]|jgi:DNA repair protein RadC|nr:DNA repair protein RadC [Chitinophagaceae bacterium]
MQAQKYSIKEWAKDDRPREKLLSIGVQALSDAELLAILLRNGSKTRSVMEIARELLQRGGGKLSNLSQFTLKEMQEIDGMGEAKAILLQAGLELGRRMETDGQEQLQLASSEDVANYLKAHLQDYRIEVFGVIFLNRANRVVHFEIISQGGITATIVDPRIVISKALDHQAVGLILCHNHPSGNLKPSMADKTLTRKLMEAASLFDIQVLDHLIVTKNGYTSFADEGLL